jgi:hypothetical protein
VGVEVPDGAPAERAAAAPLWEGANDGHSTAKRNNNDNPYAEANKNSKEKETFEHKIRKNWETHSKVCPGHDGHIKKISRRSQAEETCLPTIHSLKHKPAKKAVYPATQRVSVNNMILEELCRPCS